MADQKLTFIIAAKNLLSGELKSIDSMMKQVGTSTTEVGIAMGAVAFAIGGFELSAIRAAAGLEQTKIALETMTGSAANADRLIRDMTNFAMKTPFTLKGVEEQTKKLMAYGIEQDQVLQDLKTLGDIAAGVGTEKLGQLTLAYGQVSAATRLTGMELRQFTEAGVPLLDELAKMMGKTAGEIQEMVSKKQISFEMVRKALENLTTDGGRFANLMDKQSKSLNGMISNLGDVWEQFLRGEGQVFLEWGKDVVGALIKLVQWFSNMGEPAKNLFRIIVGGTGIFAALTVAIIATSKAIAIARGASLLALVPFAKMISLGKAMASVYGYAGVQKSFVLATGGVLGFKGALLTLIPVIGAAIVAAGYLIAKLNEISVAQNRMNASIDENISGIEIQIGKNDKLMNNSNKNVREFAELRKKQMMNEQNLQNAIRLGREDDITQFQKQGNEMHYKLVEMSKTFSEIKREVDKTNLSLNEGADLFDNLGGAGGGAAETIADATEDIQAKVEEINSLIVELQKNQVEEMISLGYEFRDSMKGITQEAIDFTQKFKEEMEKTNEEIGKNIDKIGELDLKIKTLGQSKDIDMVSQFVDQEEKIKKIMDNISKEKLKLDENLKEEKVDEKKKIEIESKLSELEAELDKEQEAYKSFEAERLKLDEQITAEKDLRSKTELEQNMIAISEKFEQKKAELEEEKKALEDKNVALQEGLEKKQEILQKDLEELDKKRKKEIESFRSYLKIREDAYLRHISNLNSMKAGVLGITSGVVEPSTEGSPTTNNNTNNQNANINVNINYSGEIDGSKIKGFALEGVNEAIRNSNLGVPQ